MKIKYENYLPFKSLLELNNVLLLEHPEHFDLPEGRLLHYLVFVGLFEFLDGDCSVSA